MSSGIGPIPSYARTPGNLPESDQWHQRVGGKKCSASSGLPRRGPSGGDPSAQFERSLGTDPDRPAVSKPARSAREQRCPRKRDDPPVSAATLHPDRAVTEAAQNDHRLAVPRMHRERDRHGAPPYPASRRRSLAGSSSSRALSAGLGSGSPRLRPTPMRTPFLAASGGSASTMTSEKGSPDSPWLRILSRKTRASQVPGPSSSCLPWSKTPPGAYRRSPFDRIATTAFASRYFNTLGTRNDMTFEATFPRPTRSRAYASPVVSPRPSQGSLPARAGSPLAGRVSHPLDDIRSLMESSHPPFLFDPPCLVALKSLSVRVFSV